EHDAIGSPLHPRRGKVSAADLEVVFPTGNAFRLAVSGGWIHGKVGITAVTSLVPLGKFNIYFVLRVDANVMRGSISEKSQHGCLIHGIDVALDGPLVSPKSHVVGRKQLRGSPFPVTIGDLKMQRTVPIDIDVGGIARSNPCHTPTGDLPGMSRP